MSSRLLPVALAALATLLGCIQAEEIDPMMKQAKYRAYSPNPLFADGRSMREPPPNTVPRERTLGSTELTRGLDAAGKTITHWPLTLTKELVDRGRAKYDVYCAICHGAAGDSKGLVSTQLSLRVPPALLEKAALTNGHIYEVIANGFGVMAGYRAELSVEERWAVVAYVRALQRAGNGRLEDLSAQARSQLKETP